MKTMISNRNQFGVLWAFLLILTKNLAIAQRPLTVSLFNESTTIPFSSFINTPVHPGPIPEQNTTLTWAVNGNCGKNR